MKYFSVHDGILISWLITKNHREFQVPKNGGTEPYQAILGVGFPVHKPYIKLIVGEDSSILGTNEMFEEKKRNMTGVTDVIPYRWDLIPSEKIVGCTPTNVPL